MYKVVGINDFAMTRSVELKNMQTNTIDICFDDSAVVSEDNFGFIKVGEKFQCKIKLFGRLGAAGRGESFVCKVVNAEVNIGRKVMVEVMVDGDHYYITRNVLKDKFVGESFIFNCTRKDLIQINEVIHADYL